MRAQWRVPSSNLKTSVLLLAQVTIDAPFWKRSPGKSNLDVSDDTEDGDACDCPLMRLNRLLAANAQMSLQSWGPGMNDKQLAIAMSMCRVLF